MMTEEEFAEELAHLVLRATPCLTAQAMRAILLDEATAQEGEIIRAKLAAGPWPPDRRPED
jgi:hypothetical protein